MSGLLQGLTSVMQSTEDVLEKGGTLVDKAKQPIRNITNPNLNLKVGANTNDLFFIGALAIGVVLIVRSLFSSEKIY